MEGLPDLDRLGGLEWARRTGGTLTRREVTSLLRPIVAGFVELATERIKLAFGARSDFSPVDITPPTSEYAAGVDRAATEQGRHWMGHGYRTWWYGMALAQVDQVALDPELFYAAAVLHDHGVPKPVPGEDFTLRSAARVAELEPAADPVRTTAIQDAITVHATPGITAQRDGALGYYVQAGAMFDLTGLRISRVSADYVADVLRRHPRAGMQRAFLNDLAGEVAAVPNGRFALLRRCGFTLGARIAPYDQR